MNEVRESKSRAFSLALRRAGILGCLGALGSRGSFDSFGFFGLDFRTGLRISAVLTTVFLSSCTMRQTLLQYGDYFAYRFIDGRVDFDEEQEKRFRPKVTTLWNEFARDKLPVLLRDLELIKSTYGKPLTDQSYGRMATRIDFWITDLSQWVAPSAAEVYASLSGKQLKKLQELYYEDREEIVERLELSDAEFREARRDKLIEVFEAWFGDILPWQKKPLFVLFGDRKAARQESWNRRKRRFEGFVSYLKTKPGTAAIERVVAGFYTDPQMITSGEDRAAFEEAKKRGFARVKSLNAHLTDEQRRHFREEIDDLIKDLKSLLPTQDKG